MEAVTRKQSKSAVIRKLLANSALTPKQIAQKVKSTQELVYQIRRQEKVKAAGKKIIPSVAQAKFKDGTPMPTYKAKPKAPQTMETRMREIDTVVRVSTLDFIVSNNLNYNLGRAVDLIVNADKSKDREKDLLFAIRHLAIDIARHNQASK